MNKQEKRKKISIGVEDFKEIIEKDGYFVDCACLFSKRNTDITSNIAKA